MTSGKTIALTRRTSVGKVMSLLFNMLSSLIITFLPRSKHLLIPWHNMVFLTVVPGGSSWERSCGAWTGYAPLFLGAGRLPRRPFPKRGHPYEIQNGIDLPNGFFFFLLFGQRPGTFSFCELLFWKFPFLNLHWTLVCPGFPQLKQESGNLGSCNPAIAWANKSALKDLVLLGKFLISLVLSHHSKNLKGWMDQCYSSVLLASKGKYILEVWGRLTRKMQREENHPPTSIHPPHPTPPHPHPSSIFGSSFYVFSSSPDPALYKSG